MRVVKILLIIFLIGIPLAIFLRFNSKQSALRSLDRQRIADLEAFSKAMDSYFKNKDHYPVLDEGGCLEDYKKELTQTLVPFYLDFVPQDPAGNSYCYFYQTKNQGELYKLAAYLQIEKAKARSDNGNLSHYYEVFNTKKTEQITNYLNYRVMSWGNNEFNQLGFENEKYKKVPVLIEKLHNITAIAAGGSNGLALTAQGEVYLWGKDQTNIILVKDLKKIKAIAVGGSHFLALSEDGKVYSWGKNDRGQLGDSTKTDRNEPVEIKNIFEIESIAAGSDFSLALSADGSIYVWGNNSRGQLGDGVPAPERVSPVKVIEIRNVKKIAAGHGHALALTEDGKIYSWGYNQYGQLGDGGDQDKNKPLEIKGLDNIEDIAAGNFHSLALGKNDLIYSWGYNEYGELGDGSAINRNKPVVISGLIGIESIVAGGEHSLAKTFSGEVYSWGYNYFGQLGDLTTTNRRVPVKVLKEKFLNFLIKEPLDNVISISAGEDFSLVIREEK